MPWLQLTTIEISFGWNDIQPQKFKTKFLTKNNPKTQQKF
jgi:hypothetical protein